MRPIALGCALVLSLWLTLEVRAYLRWRQKLMAWQ